MKRPARRLTARRLTAAVTVLSAAMALLATTAGSALAADIRFTSPHSGQEVAGPVDIEVRVNRQPTEQVDSVEVRLSPDGSSPAAGSHPVSLGCQSRCGPSPGQINQDPAQFTGWQTWGGAELDPRSPTAFGLSEPLRNGGWHLQARVNNGSWSSAVDFVVSVPPSPVSGLAGRFINGWVELSWNPSPEPDVSGYRIQRQRPGDTAWQQVGAPGPQTTSYQETAGPPGTYRYRVVTVRPDGRGGKLTATSQPVSVVVQKAGSPGGPSSGPAPPPPGPTGAGPVGGPSPGPSVGTIPPPGGLSGGGVNAPPGVRRAVQLESADRPQPPRAAPAPTRYYGENGPFSRELDYGNQGPVAAGREDEAAGGAGPRLIREVIDRFNAGPVAASMAGGLVLIALGLHTLRWMRQE